MSSTNIVHATISVDLAPAPINPAWILDGNPVARNREVARSQDGTATTLIWDCTPGKFEWHYDRDETIHVLEGAVVLNEGTSEERRIGPGDIVFFPAGSRARWHVQSHVRKLAFFRRALPKPVGHILNALRSIKRWRNRELDSILVGGPAFGLPQHGIAD